MEEVTRNPFDESVFSIICGINALIITDEVSKDTKTLTKLNRFKQWLLNYQDGQSK